MTDTVSSHKHIFSLKPFYMLCKFFSYLLGCGMIVLAQAQIQNVALHQQVIVDSNYRPPENTGPFAVDGDKDPAHVASRWVSGKGYPHFIEVQLDQDYDIFQVAFYTGYKKYNYPVADYQVQYWSDSEWVDLVSRTGNSSASVFETFNTVTTDRIRLYATRGSDDILRLYEFEVYGFVGNDNGGGGGNGPAGTGLWHAKGDTLYTEATVPVGIGTMTPDAPLTVKGQIHCEEVKVDLSIPAPDYVFDASYEPLSLEALEAFITEHKHLPYLPKGEIMNEKGANIGQNQYAILRTVEELVLHQISMQKELNNLITQNKALLEQLNRRKDQ